jgi:hypothetical protein
MSVRRVIVQAGLAAILGVTFFSLGTYIAARQHSHNEAKIDALRAEVARTLLVVRDGQSPRSAGTSGRVQEAALVPDDAGVRAELMDEIKRQLQAEMGLMPVQLLRERRDSFVELYSYDNHGASNYGTAGYLGDGYFITVKHGVVALPRPGEDPQNPRRIVSIKIVHRGQSLRARLVDAGDALVEVDRGDWAIINVRESIDLPPLRLDLAYPYEFADPIFRLGNDYSKGIILSTGYVGQQANGLVTCLTDGHPGVSGGGVLNQAGDLVGIPVGRMQGDYRFSFILPLRAEMFRKVPGFLEGEGRGSGSAVASRIP